MKKHEIKKYPKGISNMVLIVIMVISTNLISQNTSIFPQRNKAPNIHHTGDVWLHHLSAADSIFDYNIAVAKFAVNAKLDWHLHPKGQQLIIVEGMGYYQERGKSIQLVQKGDIIKCQPNIEHWHAATTESGVTYLAISGNKPTIWKERVSKKLFESINLDSLKNQTIKQEIISLSKEKWKWMSEKNVMKLKNLFHKNSVFVHMGGTWGKNREIDIIKKGNIHYKKADIHEVSVNVFDTTAILLNKITLLAIVGGKEVVNPFMVTEVYKKEDKEWKLTSLSFTKLLN